MRRVKSRPLLQGPARLAKICMHNLRFAAQNLRLFPRRKIIYALTPPARLRNVGDHAQAIAIHEWFEKHFGGVPVVELDKDRSTELLPVLRFFISHRDVIFLHSGGNLGDRGKWSENARRALIAHFHRTRVISLPQTIFFSDTSDGRIEREKTVSVYGQHPRLTVMGRDPRSAGLAAQMFPGAHTLCMPDFVLSLPGQPPVHRSCPASILLCLRLDNESALEESTREIMERQIPYHTRRYDTTLDHPIEPSRRSDELRAALSVFEAHDAVVTDRFHGVIFSVLCGKPVVVLQTVDHKLSSAMEWFTDLRHVKMVNDPVDVPAAIEEVLSVQSLTTIDWNARYFDRLPGILGLTGFPTGTEAQR